jgi:hypothetical protein
MIVKIDPVGRRRVRLKASNYGDLRGEARINQIFIQINNIWF